MSSSPANSKIPPEMLAQGRGEDPDFSPEERLFYRLNENYRVGEQPTGLDVHKPDFSVNREKHGGKPEYVLIPDWPDHGIAEFAVGSIPGPITSEGGKVHSWQVKHVPLDENYHHSEIHTYTNGVRASKSHQVNKTVYRIFRQLLSEQMVVIRSFKG